MNIVLERDELAEMDPAARRLALRSIVAEHSRGGPAAALVAQLSDAIDGFGPLTDLMRDDDVTDVLVNGPSEVWVERSGALQKTDVAFDDDHHLLTFIERMLVRGGGRADTSRPLADVRLRDGSRMHVALAPVSRRGPLVSIRRFPRTSFTLDDLVARRMMSQSEADVLVDAVQTRVTMAISGGTGTGKTTLLNALLGCVPDGERIVVIEETPELHPACAHVVSLLARPPNTEGAGAIGMAALVRSALRMRPDRIVVGEVRGGEAIAALAAMSTGHEGSLVTVHARSAGDVADRLAACALQSGSGADEQSLRAQFEATFGIVIHLERVEGRRRIVQILRRE
jgi:pilus assembly protein CpaF